MTNAPVISRSFPWRSNCRSWPAHGWVGLALVAVFWILNWSLDGLRTHWGFFPLWLGYCLTVDALVFSRKGHSLLSRGAASYAGLFLASAPAWWLFEGINGRTQNWSYLGEQYFTDVQYFLFSTLSFSTVMPAVFETAELAGTFAWIRKLKTGRPIPIQRRHLPALFGAGWLMLALLIGQPSYFYPLVWGALYLILDPVNCRLGYRSLLDDIRKGDWQPVAALCTGCLICGFFWEMWNYYSYPKWIYHIPFVDFLRIFEMPVLGYLGYLPFSLELFALYHLLSGLFSRGRTGDYIQLN